MTQTATVPGLNVSTSTAELIGLLRTAPQTPLEFYLNGELMVQPGYHVTEVKAVSIESMDCGGKAASWRETVIQLMDGSAEELQRGHMSNRKFLAIYDRVSSRIPVHGEAEVRFEYGNASVPAMQYHVSHAEHQAQRLIVHLLAPGVQCKAGDACGVPVSSTGSDSCSPATGCCTPAPAELMTLS
jgi:Family of unknown function (DUF6428)